MPASPSPLYNVLSFGAGAIGTYIGGSLALQGHRVLFLERPEIATEIQQRGLRLNLQGQERQISEPKTASSLEEALSKGPFDLALFALKSYDTSSALEEMQRFREAMPPVVCFQNGVDNEPALASALGPEKVIAGTVTSAIGRRAAGDIILERLRGMGVAVNHPLSRDFVMALGSAGLNARLYPDAAAMKWSKMLTNLLANASSAILDMTPAEIFGDPRLYKLEVQQLRETLAVMAAQGISPVDLPGTPVRALAFGVRFLPYALSRPFLQKAVGGGRGGKMPSFYIDLHNGRGKSEVGYLNGAVVRYGEKLNIPTPANRLLNDTLQGLTQGKTPLEMFSHQPEKFLARV